MTIKAGEATNHEVGDVMDFARLLNNYNEEKEKEASQPQPLTCTSLSVIDQHGRKRIFMGTEKNESPFFMLTGKDEKGRVMLVQDEKRGYVFTYDDKGRLIDQSP